MRLLIFSYVGNSKMSNNEDFKDSTNAASVALVVGAMVLVPLFPMLMGWFNILK